MYTPRLGSRFALLLMIGVPGFSTFAQTPAGPVRTDVPVRTVVLYSSGVGYFEHAGTVRGTGSTDIRFKTDQINDVLKSLVLQDRDGGRVTAITYPSRDPVAKTLKSFQIDITGNPGLADILNQVRGARITAQVGAEQVRGTILGVEQRRKIGDRGEPILLPALNIMTGATIRAFDLLSIRALSLDDPKLEDELVRALAALSQSRDQDKKPVTINFTGTGDRRLRIGYVVEAPVWKTSYRLILDGPSARLQGWAIVENQTESDWNDVSLSLVSGRPISFSMDLYQPLYATRPKVVAEQYASLRPQVYDEAVLAKSADASSLYGARAANGAIVIQTAAPESRTMRVSNSVAALHAVVVNGEEGAQWFEDSTVQAIAQTARLGELFQYSVPGVTLARQKSAMIPIVTDSVCVDRVSIYNPSVLATHPLNGVRLTNVTGKHLLQGPVTVLDADRYAGDARIDNIPPGQDRLLSYGIDLDVLVNRENQRDTTTVLTARIVKGLLTVDQRLTSWEDYVIDNKGDKEKAVVIEHSYREGWHLVDTPKPRETTPTVHRFQVSVAAKKARTLTVKEELVRAQKTIIAAVKLDVLVYYSRSGAIPAAVRDALTRAIQIREEVADAERQMGERTLQITTITVEQQRIRDNMKTVAVGTQYYKRLLQKLNEQESAIERLQHERDDQTKRRDERRKALEDYVAVLTIG